MEFIFNPGDRNLKIATMDTATLILLTAIGLVVGFFGGMFGVGGGVILIPALVYIMGMEQHTAQGTSVAIMLPPIGIVAAYNYYKAGHVDFKYALIIAAAFIIGSFFGSKLAVNLPDQLSKKIFAVIMFGISVRMFFFK
jgi:uncharacterized membrane protein YfcA